MQSKNTEQNNLFFFQQDDQTNKKNQTPIQSQSFYKTQKQKLINRQVNMTNTMGKNMFQSDNHDFYDYESLNVKQTKTNQYNKTNKQMIYEPGKKRSKLKNIPQLEKSKFENKQQQIKYDLKQKKKIKQDEQQIQQDNIIEIKIDNGSKGQKKQNKQLIKNKERQEQQAKQIKQVKQVKQIKQIKQEQKKKQKQKPKKHTKYNTKNQTQLPKQIQKKQQQIKKQPIQDSQQQKQQENLPTHNQQTTNPISNIPQPMKLQQIGDRKVFITKPIPKGMILQCTVKRDKSGFGRFFPHYDMYVSDKFKYLMSGKRRAGNTTSNYVISSDKNDMESKGPNYLGKVRSNFVGTQFFVYDDGVNPEKLQVGLKLRKILGQIYYQSNFFGSKGPRKMTCYVPNLQNPPSEYNNLRFLNENHTKQALKLINKPPKWNQQMRAYVLNFNGRVDKPSVKNFILINQADQDNNILLFGRIGEDTFNVDVRYPLSPLQAFGMILTSFDYKIACQ